MFGLGSNAIIIAVVGILIAVFALSFVQFSEAPEVEFSDNEEEIPTEPIQEEKAATPEIPDQVSPKKTAPVIEEKPQEQPVKKIDLTQPDLTQQFSALEKELLESQASGSYLAEEHSKRISGDILNLESQGYSASEIERLRQLVLDLSPHLQDQLKQEAAVITEESSVTLDPCVNSLGNGGEIISGPSGPENGDRDNPFHSLTVHPTDPNYILVGTERNGFLRSTDGGITWERLRYGLRHSGGGYPEIYDISIAESNPDIIYAATVGSPGPLTISWVTSGVYKSTDGGKTWQRKNCGIENNGGRTTAVYVDPADPSHAFIAISGGETSYSTADQPAGIYIDGGVYETINGGDNWTLLNVAPNDRKQELRVFRRPSSNKNTIYLFGTTFDDDRDMSIVKSTDNGKTWQQFGLSFGNNFEGSFDVSPDGNTIYIHSNEYKIYKSMDGGAAWTPHDVILTSGYTLTVSPLDSNRVIFGQTNGLFLSTDGLSTVTKVLDIDENAGRISDLVFAASAPNIVYMITGGYIIYKSTDGGATFSKIGNLRDEVLNKNP